MRIFKLLRRPLCKHLLVTYHPCRMCEFMVWECKTCGKIKRIA